MPKVVRSTIVDVPVDRLWAVVRDFNAHDQYHPIVATSLKVSGVPLYSIGDIEGRGAEVIALEDEAAGVYRKLVVRDGRLAGAVLYGDTADALWYRDLVARRTRIDGVRAALPFGRAYAEAA